MSLDEGPEGDSNYFDFDFQKAELKGTIRDCNASFPELCTLAGVSEESAERILNSAQVADAQAFDIYNRLSAALSQVQEKKGVIQRHHASAWKTLRNLIWACIYKNEIKLRMGREFETYMWERFGRGVQFAGEGRDRIPPPESLLDMARWFQRFLKDRGL